MCISQSIRTSSTGMSAPLLLRSFDFWTADFRSKIRNPNPKSNHGLIFVPSVSPDERLADAVDADRAENARGLAHRFHGLLQCDGVEDGCEHAHVVGGGAGNVSIFSERRATDEVAAAHDDTKLHAHLRDFNA